MASVYHLFEENYFTECELSRKYSEISHSKYYIILAAIKIQKSFRGYIERYHYKKTMSAIVLIQKLARGWYQRFLLVQEWQKYYNIQTLKYFYDMATRIQALWRGYQVRKSVNVIEIMKKRESVQAENMRFKQQMADAFGAEKDPVSIKNQEFYIEDIVGTLFNRHHLLRTQQKEGILSEHGSKEFSIIEKLLQSISYSSYIKQTRKMYEMCYNTCNGPPYRYNHKHLRQLEKLSRESKVVQDRRHLCYKEKAELNTKEFYGKLRDPPYVKSIFSCEQYKPPVKNISRTVDKSKNVCDEDFNLFTLKKAIKENEIPPFYLESWFGRRCPIHNLLDY